MFKFTPIMKVKKTYRGLRFLFLNAILLFMCLFSLKAQLSIKNIGAKNIKSSSFLKKVEVYKNIYSQTGTLINTQYIYIKHSQEQSRYVPLNDIFFNIDFEEEIALKKSLFTLSDQD